MRHLTVLTVLTVVMSMKSLACAVASEPIISLGANAASRYVLGIDKVYHFDKNYMDIGYIWTEAPKRCITFVLNGGAGIGIISYHADIFIDLFVLETDVFVPPKSVAVGGYRRHNTNRLGSRINIP